LAAGQDAVVIAAAGWSVLPWTTWQCLLTSLWANSRAPSTTGSSVIRGPTRGSRPHSSARSRRNLLPKELGGRRLRIFRDEEDFTGTEYYRAVDQHLTSSNCLIVVCSPAARASRFVNEEIAAFARARGADRIIPVLVAGRSRHRFVTSGRCTIRVSVRMAHD